MRFLTTLHVLKIRSMLLGGFCVGPFCNKPDSAHSWHNTQQTPTQLPAWTNPSIIFLTVSNAASYPSSPYAKAGRYFLMSQPVAYPEASLPRDRSHVIALQTDILSPGSMVSSFCTKFLYQNGRFNSESWPAVSRASHACIVVASFPR